MLKLFLIVSAFLASAYARPSFFPKDWKSYKVVNATTPVTGYFVEAMYRSNTCDGSPERTEATGIGACIGGFDEQGNPISSYSMTFDHIDEEYLYANQYQYKSNDCSGNPSFSYLGKFSLSCEYGEKYIYTDSPNPWSGLNDGIVVHSYVASECSNPVKDATTGGDVWQAVAFNYCMGIADPGNGASTFQYKSCTSAEGGDIITATYYSDWGCTQEISTVTFSSTCQACPSSTNCYPQAMWYQTQEIMTCNN